MNERQEVVAERIEVARRISTAASDPAAVTHESGDIIIDPECEKDLTGNLHDDLEFGSGRRNRVDYFRTAVTDNEYNLFGKFVGDPMPEEWYAQAFRNKNAQWDCYYDKVSYDPLQSKVSYANTPERYLRYDHKKALVHYDVHAVAFNPGDPAHYVNPTDYDYVQDPPQRARVEAEKVVGLIHGYLHRLGNRDDRPVIGSRDPISRACTMDAGNWVRLENPEFGRQEAGETMTDPDPSQVACCRREH